MAEDWLAIMMRVLKSPTHEGCVAYLYLDSGGNPTIGVGHLVALREDAMDDRTLRAGLSRLYDYGVYWLPSQGSLRSLLMKATGVISPGSKRAWPIGAPTRSLRTESPFTTEDAAPGPWGVVQGATSSRASDIEAMVLETNLLLNQHYPNKASYYQHFTGFRMDEGAIDRMLVDDIDELVDEIKQKFLPNFDAYPTAARLAIVDLRFRGDLHYESKFGQAIRARDWKRAVELCPQPKTVSAQRNADRLDWLKEVQARLSPTIQ